MAFTLSSPVRKSRGPRRGWFALCAAAIAMFVTGLPNVGWTAPDESWEVRSGVVHLLFNVDLLGDLGIDLEITGAETTSDDPHLAEPNWTLAILPGSNLAFQTEHGNVLARGGTAGAIRMSGALRLRDRASGKITRLDALEIAHGDLPTPAGPRGTDPLLLRSATSGLAFCDLRHGMFDFRQRPRLEVHYLNARITAEWAKAVGRPELAGWVIGMAEVRAGTERVATTGAVEPAPPPNFTVGTLDVSLGHLSDIQEVDHDGLYPTGRAALAMSTTSCNVGTVDVPWLAPMQENHPLIHMALYRLRDDRFEQIGVSWLKHGFYALSDADCSPCQHPSDGSYLGVGCSDTYDVYNNSYQDVLGPRSEVNAYTGAWECTGSHFAGGQPDCVWRHFNQSHTALAHRLDVDDVDLANPGATYIYEARYIVVGDQNPTNNWGHRRCTAIWTGSAWAFSTPAINNPLIPGPALADWGGATTTVDMAPQDGQVLLSVKVTQLDSDTYHYEYALMNLTSDRQIRSFSVPAQGVPNVANIGFHDGDPSAGNDWQVTADGQTITWETGIYGVGSNANPLVFGYLYNFRFDADAPPTAVNATLGLYKPGRDASVEAATSGPSGQVAAVGDEVALPARVIDVRPNPFTHSATISYQVSAGPADLSIYDASGRLVRTLVSRSDGSGVRSVVWNGDDDRGRRARSGVYYARIKSGPMIAARPLVLAD